MTHRALLVPAIAIALAACGRSEAPTPVAEPTTTSAAPAAAAAPEEKILNVYNWSDYIAEDTIARFEAETGIDVSYDVYDTNEILEAKLMTGNSGYDLVFPSARPFAARHVKSGLYAPLDKAQLTNYANLDPAVLAGLADFDPGNAHVVPYLWGTTGIGYNVAKLRERLGADAPLDSWSLLFDPATAAKLADCGISVLDDEQDAFGAALIHLGRDPNANGGDENDAVAKLYGAVRPHIRYFNSSKFIDDLANGEICIAMGYSGDVVQARDRAEEAANGVEIAYAIPKEGAMRWIDTAAIPADAPHSGNAQRLIDFLLRPEVGAGIANYVAYATPNTKALPLVEEALRNDPNLYPPGEVAAKLVDPKTLPDDVQRARVRTWTSIKTGH